MSSVDTGSFLHGFDVATRTLHISVRNLWLSRGWTAYGLLSSPDDPPRPSSIGESVGGVATLIKDSLAVIGSETPETKRLSFWLRSFDNWDALAETWRNHRNDWGDPLRRVENGAGNQSDERLLGFLRHVYQDFELRPPTVSVTFAKADWEIGNSDEWYLECSVPRPILAALVNDMRSASVRRVELAVTLAPTLVSEKYAPPSVPVTLGILRMGRHSSGEGRGWVENIGWRVVSREGSDFTTERGRRSARLAPTQDENPAANSSEPLPSQVLASLSAETRRLSQTIRGGFILTLVLLLIMAIFVR
jgi:hypothetical protein